jgi:hypothetical protein
MRLVQLKTCGATPRCARRRALPPSTLGRRFNLHARDCSHPDGRSFSVLVRQSLTTCALSRRRSRSASAKTYAFTMGMSWRLASKASEGCPGTPCTLVAKVLRFQEPRRSTVSLPTLPSIQLQILRGSAALPMSTRLPAARAWRPPTCRDSANPPWQ